jgi:hypothetical protein
MRGGGADDVLMITSPHKPAVLEHFRRDPPPKYG